MKVQVECVSVYVTIMFIVKFAVLLHYADSLTSHFDRIPIFVLQCDWFVLSKWPRL